MKWQVDMKVKDYIRNWSDQEIHTQYCCFFMMDIFMNQYHMKLMGLKWNVKSLLHYHFIKQTKCGIVQNY